MACPTCGSRGVDFPPPAAPAKDARRERRWKIIIILMFGALGVIWDGLAAAVLFRNYSFFESVVVCLLVMILCAAATVRADFEVWFRRADATSQTNEDNLLNQLRGIVKVIFYSIAFLMALVKLVLTLLS